MFKRLSLLLLLFLSFDVLSQTLKILCWQGYATKEYVEDFEKLIKKKYKIDLKVIVKDVSDPQEFYDALRGRNADLISPAHNIPKSYQWPLIQFNLTLPINLKNIPNYKNIIPSLKKSYFVSDYKNTYGVPIVYGSYGLLYNTKFFKKAPKSWNIFWDPRWKGKYSISSDYFEANIYIALLSLGVPAKYLFDINSADNQDVKKRLIRLARNSSSFWKGVDNAKDLKGLAFATGWGFSIPELNKEGEVWKMATPKEGTSGWVDHWMIGHSLKNKPKLKRIAEEWINYSISPKIQAKYVRNIAQFPVNTKVKNLLTKKEIDTFHINEPDYIKKNLILWKVLSKREQETYKLLWDNAKSKK